MNRDKTTREQALMPTGGGGGLTREQLKNSPSPHHYEKKDSAWRENMSQYKKIENYTIPK